MPDQVTGWRKATRSAQQTACVEVGRIPGGAAVRDTKNRGAGHITATRTQWTAFLTALKSGRMEG